MFTILITTNGAEWEWAVPTEKADAVWRLLGKPDRVHIVTPEAPRHGGLDGQPDQIHLVRPPEI